MWGATFPFRWQRHGSFAGSLLTHCLLLAGVFWFSVPKPLPVPPSGAIMVDLVPDMDLPPRPAEQLDVLSAPSVGPVPVATPAEQPPPSEMPQAQTRGDGMIAATRFYAASILSDPANREVRENFPLLAGQEQVVQLCNIEALEQLREAKPDEAPDALVGYAFDSIDVTGLDLVADGGAFRSHGQWRHIRYRCAVAPDIHSVAAFEYALGELVPESEWEAHFLNASEE